MISQERQWKVFRDKDDLDCGGRIGRISLGIGRSGECVKVCKQLTSMCPPKHV